MTKQKKEKNENVSGEAREKQMILKLDHHKHAWVKSIAEATGTTQPNVVNLILAEASKAHADDYIDQIKRLHAKEALKQLEAEHYEKEAEIKRLKELLDS